MLPAFRQDGIDKEEKGLNEMGTVMKPIIKKQRKTLMSAKFYKMLLSGTLSMTVVSLL